MIRAKAYMTFAPPNSQLVKELKLRTKEVDMWSVELTRILIYLGENEKHGDLTIQSQPCFPRLLCHGHKTAFYDDSAEEQVVLQKKQVTFLYHLAGSTTPKGLHCLSLQLTAEYFALESKERQFPNRHKLHDPQLYHCAVFSDNVLACAVVVNSTVSTAMEPEKIVFHVVTDSLNFPALSILLEKATIEVQSMESFVTSVEC